MLHPITIKYYLWRIHKNQFSFVAASDEQSQLAVVWDGDKNQAYFKESIYIITEGLASIMGKEGRAANPIN